MNKLKRISPFDESSCCGCLACQEACPQMAISMVENEKGFIIPSIDDNKCTNCGHCLKVCAFKKESNKKSNIEQAYSLIIKDKKVLKFSTSGGAFSALSDIVLNTSGFVVGSVMREDFSIRHMVANNKEDRDKMRGSKYVQSCTQGIWGQVKQLLIQGQQVLFTGTPCQCAALKSFLGKDYDNLIVVDFLCHGVPNNKMFKEHISYLNHYYNNTLVGFSFRNKTYGWDSYNNIINLSNGQRKTRWINQIYYNFFINNLSLRPSCHHCPYRSLFRPSDITVADFWGIEKLTGRKSHDGVSLVLTHTEKGHRLLDKAKDTCQIKEYPVEKITYRMAVIPSKPNAKSEAFWKTYIDQGYEGVARSFFNDSYKNRIRFEFRKIVKRLGIV